MKGRASAYGGDVNDFDWATVEHKKKMGELNVIALNSGLAFVAVEAIIFGNRGGRRHIAGIREPLSHVKMDVVVAALHMTSIGSVNAPMRKHSASELYRSNVRGEVPIFPRDEKLRSGRVVSHRQNVGRGLSAVGVLLVIFGTH
jgi:hypothetical protein